MRSAFGKPRIIVILIRQAGLASTILIGLGEHTLDWISLLADRNYHSQ
ncbi:hypothetical protein [Paenibacillus odorifer]|nr:hypothetical protein [Paenibacillus odorifer]